MNRRPRSLAGIPAALLAILTLLVPYLACAQAIGPKLVVEGGASHALGVITHADRPEHRFVLRNTSADTVRITSVRAGCGCTAAVLSGKTLPPGGEATIDVRFTPIRSTNGHVSKSISVYTENDDQKMYLLRIEADVVSSFEATPEKANLDTLVTRNVAETVLKLTNVSADTQRIVQVQGVLSVEHRGYGGKQSPQMMSIDDVQASPVEFVLAPGETQEVTIRFFPLNEGRLMGSVVFYSGEENRQVEFSGVIRRP
ncbi:MAG: DUF1573 domain-containing protein [Bacteroidetes bacterium]|nr:DUF1573 domain-containing protein [Bacteroidota bacterium]